MWPEALCTICYIIPKIHWFLCVYMKFEKVNISNNSVWKYHDRMNVLHTSVCWVFFFFFFFIVFFYFGFVLFLFFFNRWFFWGCIFALIFGVDCIVLIFCTLHCIIFWGYFFLGGWVFWCFFLFLLLLFYFFI